MKECAPIVLFAYNRKDLLKDTIECLKANDLSKESDLFVFSDGAKGDLDFEQVKAVRSYLRSITGFKTITLKEAERNRGLAASVITGVDEVIRAYGKVIVVEDDLHISRSFLSYINAALSSYDTSKHVFSVTGYTYPSHRLQIPELYPHDVYLSYRAHSWTWATWLDRWKDIDWDVSEYPRLLLDPTELELFQRGGKDMGDMLSRQVYGELDSWAIRYCFAQHLYKGYTVFPRKSLVQNNGFGVNATHCFGSSVPYDVEIDDDWLPNCFPKLAVPDGIIAERFCNLFANRDIAIWKQKYLLEKEAGHAG